MNRWMVPNVAARRAPETFLDFVVGVDLGQSNNYTAIVVVRRRLVESNRLDGVTFGWQPDVSERAAVRVERMPLRTPYPAVNARLAEIDRRLRTLAPGSAGPHFCVDQTGGGIPVCDFLRPVLGARLHAVTFTSGLSVTGTRQNPNVPKVHLISWLTADLQNGQLVLADGMPYLEVLEKELIGMQATATAGGRVVMAAGQSSEHDDLVCAASLANYGARELPFGRAPRQGRVL